MELVKVSETNRVLFYNLFNIYLYEMSQYNRRILPSMNLEGRLYPQMTDNYFYQRNCNTFIIKNESDIAGILVVSSDKQKKEFQYEVNEIFLLPPYRNGKYAFELIQKTMENNHGKYRVLVLRENTRAQRFWKSYIEKNATKYVIRQYNDILDEFLFDY